MEFSVVTVPLLSPKSHRYVAMVPMGEEEPDPSNETVSPLTVEIKAAVGAWSGVMPMP